MRNLIVSCAALLISSAASQAADNTQNVTFGDSVQIPGGSLKAGAYTLGLEDRLPDRAIVRITNAQNASEHYLLLTVPNPKMAAPASDHLAFFKGSSAGKRVLRAWNCADCSAPLEFVYPKLEAVKITDDTTDPVLAVDPAYDKLPGNLSQDDMKVVTLWLLAPERITADNVGQGVKAAKYSPDAAAQSADAAAAPTAPAASATPAAAPVVAATPAPAPAAPTTPIQTASASSANMTDQSMTHARRHLPKTASNTYLFALCGLGCLVGAFALRARRVHSL